MPWRHGKWIFVLRGKGCRRRVRQPWFGKFRGRLVPAYIAVDPEAWGVCAHCTLHAYALHGLHSLTCCTLCHLLHRLGCVLRPQVDSPTNPSRHQ